MLYKLNAGLVVVIADDEATGCIMGATASCYISRFDVIFCHLDLHLSITQYKELVYFTRVYSDPLLHNVSHFTNSTE